MRLVVAILVQSLCGCAMTAKVDLAAADAVDQLTRSLGESVEEYHRDLRSVDDAREESVVRSIAARLRAAGSDEAAAEADVQAFLAAMARMRADRETAWRRYSASMDNLGELHALARGLRRLAVESMSLDDEARRYFGELVEVAGRSRAAESK